MNLTRQRFIRASGGATVLWLLGCGGDDGDGTTTLPSGTGCQPLSISDNHGHTFTIPEADLDATADQVYVSIGAADHTHGITLTPAQLADLKAGQEVTVTTTSASSGTTAVHAHTVVLKCL